MQPPHTRPRRRPLRDDAFRTEADSLHLVDAPDAEPGVGQPAKRLLCREAAKVGHADERRRRLLATAAGGARHDGYSQSHDPHTPCVGATESPP